MKNLQMAKPRRTSLGREIVRLALKFAGMIVVVGVAWLLYVLLWSLAGG